MAVASAPCLGLPLITLAEEHRPYPRPHAYRLGLGSETACSYCSAFHVIARIVAISNAVVFSRAPAADWRHRPDQNRIASSLERGACGRQASDSSKSSVRSLAE